MEPGAGRGVDTRVLVTTGSLDLPGLPAAVDVDAIYLDAREPT